MKYRIATSIIFLFLVCQSIFAEVPDKDTINFSKEAIRNINIENNLDSLVNLWYIKESLKNDSINIILPVTTSISTPNLSDSVYIERINKILSVIPLSYNKIVKNFIKLYTEKRRGQVEVMLGLTEYYFPIFESILDQYDLPLELKYMPIIESALNPRAVSRVGATGLWQFMYRTGSAYKLTINSFVDERRDPVKSTRAASKYLRDLYNMYNDWILVIAAYNCGPGNVNKAIRRSGGKRDYWDIYYYLPRETRGYVPAFIAAFYTMEYFEDHKLTPRKIDISLNTDTLMINDDLHLQQVAEVLNIPIQQLQDMNPQYRRNIIPGKHKSYALKIPSEYSGTFIDFQDSIFAYKDDVFMNPDILKKPATRSKYYHQPPKGKVKIYYTVKSGDNLGYIAEWFRVRASDLRYWNGIRRNLIRSGQKLVIYVPKNKVGKYKKLNSMTFAEKQKTIGKTVVLAQSETKANSTTGESGFVYYKVRYGDTLWEIAKKFPGVSDSDIMRLNDLKNSKIVPGQTIKIKKQ